MKNIVFIILFLLSNVVANDSGFTYNPDAGIGDAIVSYDGDAVVTLSESEASKNYYLDETSSLAAGGSMLVIHMIFWLPIFLAFITFSAFVVAAYLLIEKDKLWKFLGMLFVGLVSATVLFNLSLSFVDNFSDVENCGNKIFIGYLSDGVNAAIDTNHKFGTKILETGCF